MDNDKKLQTIANSFNAVAKIRDIYRTSLQRNTRSNIHDSNVTMMAEILKVLAENSPDRYRSGMFKTVTKTTQLSNAYRRLKGQLREARKSRTNLQSIMDILETLKPALDPKSYVYVDKMIKIHKILKS